MSARTIWLLLAGLAAGGPALAQLHQQLPDPLLGRNWAAGCTGCHASDWLSGRDALYATLLDFKSGRRPATVMQQLSRGYDDEQLRAIADHFSGRPAP
ncbi:class I cytochrome c [Malikia spinosa]|uniref:Class I cytochrome c n=1 Tax=Malikia spinosa TaxID=86180 RepID=A0A2S9KBZ0_9BURK|nr:class I cytochrome c [Malikia spinosa]PRD67971.1 class I cytochrome c [Malikia spinosa]